MLTRCLQFVCSSCLQWVFIEKSEYTQIVHAGKGSDVEVVELWPRCLGFLTSFKPQEARWNLQRWPAIIENQEIIWGYPALCKCIHAFGCFHAIGYPTPILAFHRWVHSREMLTITFTIFFAIERSSRTGNWRQHSIYSGNLNCFSIVYQCLPAVTMCFLGQKHWCFYRFLATVSWFNFKILISLGSHSQSSLLEDVVTAKFLLKRNGSHVAGTISDNHIESCA